MLIFAAVLFKLNVEISIFFVLMEKEKKNEETVLNTVNKLAKEMKPLDNDISEWIDKNFWKLI